MLRLNHFSASTLRIPIQAATGCTKSASKGMVIEKTDSSTRNSELVFKEKTIS